MYRLLLQEQELKLQETLKLLAGKSQEDMGIPRTHCSRYAWQVRAVMISDTRSLGRVN